MYDIDIYTYKEKPETNSGKYNIYPLNDKGNDKYYFKKESHVTTYIDYLNPIIYNHIVGGGKETLTNKENETSFDVLSDADNTQDNNQSESLLPDSTTHITNEIFNNNNEINIDDIEKYLVKYSYMSSNIKKLIDFLLLEIVESH